MNKQIGIWKCKDGSSLRVCDMSDSHLLHSIRMVERKVLQHQSAELSAAYSIAPMLSGEMAIWVAESDIDRMEEETTDDILEVAYAQIPQYKWLCDEAERRKLTKLTL